MSHIILRIGTSCTPIQGCDASVLLASPSNTAEKDHPDDISLAGDGFDTVVKAKAAVDGNPKCRNKVSCADILALATRDVIALVSDTTYLLWIIGVFGIFSEVFLAWNCMFV